jgi:hypothetical protein
LFLELAAEPALDLPLLDLALEVFPLEDLALEDLVLEDDDRAPDKREELLFRDLPLDFEGMTISWLE